MGVQHKMSITEGRIKIFDQFKTMHLNPVACLSGLRKNFGPAVNSEILRNSILSKKKYMHLTRNMFQM